MFHLHRYMNLIAEMRKFLKVNNFTQALPPHFVVSRECKQWRVTHRDAWHLYVGTLYGLCRSAHTSSHADM